MAKKLEEEKKQSIQIKRKNSIKKNKMDKNNQDKIKALRGKLKKREAEIKVYKKEKDDLRDEFLRKVAEMENLKKRLEREKSEFYQYALFEFLKELLVILDNFKRALESHDRKDSKSFREGIQMIYKQYLNLLIKQGVKPVEIKDKKFDPHLHQAFMAEESEDVEEPEIVEELQGGYTLHDRLLRPALVKVVVPKRS